MFHISKRYRAASRFAAVTILLAFSVLLSSCAHNVPDPKPAITPGVKETTVFVASDLHLFSENLISPDNELYIKENFSSDGKVQEYDYEIVEALVDTVNSEKPDYLVLTGDLSFNGEKDSHLELAKLLSEAKHTKILVLPGNHDIYSVSCVSANGDKTAPTDNIDSQEFRKIYAPFGYAGAYSYDENSLSYIYALSDDKWALMLDTTQSKYNETNGYNIVGGFLEGPTMLWLEENLKYAKENGISVVSFTHHNLLVHNELFKSSYTLYNYEALLKLYSEYDVSLNFSGHLHIQSIKSASIDEREIYDVSSGSLLDYGNRYGKLEIYDNCYCYESRLLDFADSNAGLREHSFNVFCDEYYAKTVTQYQNSLGEADGEAATRLLSQINAYYFDGSYVQIHDLIDDNKSLVEKIRNSTINYDMSYVKSIIDVPEEDQHSLLIGRHSK